jgi:hypothetical protein
VLVLSAVDTMTPGLLRKVESLISAGATVIGGPPRTSPSLAGYPECDREVSVAAAALWGGTAPPATVTRRAHGSGSLYWGGALSATAAGEIYPAYEATVQVLTAEKVRPDFVTSAPFRYAHHTFPDREVYFVSNRSGEPLTGVVHFRDGARVAERWDAVDGTFARLPVRSVSPGAGADATLHLDAYQSAFVVFYRNGGPDIATSPALAEGGRVETRVELTGPWSVAFDPGWGGPERIVFDRLSDWTQRPEEGIRFYSGIARYSKTFDLPTPPATTRPTRWVLDLGTVKNLARVRLNGKDLGVVWTAPWQVEITGAVQPQHNRLEIDVANLWINRLIGDEQFPDDGVQKGRWPDWVLNGTPRPTQRFTFTTHRFYKWGDPLQSSGLLGPVAVVSRN